MGKIQDLIRDAVEKLDPENDEHWTSTGLPQMKVIEDMIGDDTIKRGDVNQALGGDFKRGDKIPEVQADPVEEATKEFKNGDNSIANLLRIQRKHDQMRKEQAEKDRRQELIDLMARTFPSLSPDEQNYVTGG